MPIIADLVKYSRLALGLRGYLRGTVTLEESQRVVAERLRNRQQNFLSLVQKGINQNPKSPFLKLLEVAGCQFGDIEAGVNQDGIEATLQKLMEAGVYIDWEEFKGRKEVVRGGRHFQFKERDFDNPYLPVYYQKQSSGSRSPGTRTTFDLTNVLRPGQLHFTLKLLVLAILVKLVPSLIFTLQRLSLKTAMKAGILLSARLSLIMAAAEIGLRERLISPAVKDSIVLLALLTCFLGPTLFKLTYKDPEPEAEKEPKKE